MEEQKEEQRTTDLYTALAVDLDKVENGYWDKDFQPGLDLRIARAGSKRYQEMYQRLVDEAQAAKAMDGGGDLDPDVGEEIIVKCIAHTILVGWRNLKYKGEMLDYSPEKAFEILSEPEMREFRERVWRRASRLESYLKGRDEADVGN